MKHVTMLIVLLLLPFSLSVCSLTPILLCSIYFDGAEIKDTSTTTTTITVKKQLKTLGRMFRLISGAIINAVRLR